MAAAVTHNSDSQSNRHLVEAPVVRAIQWAVTQTQNTRVVSGERRGSGSHSGEWRGGGVLSGARGKGTAVTCTRAETERKL